MTRLLDAHALINASTSALYTCIRSGRSFVSNSGFDGVVGWDDHPQLLENGYYNSMLSFERFVPTLNPAVPPNFPDQFFWEAPPDNGGHFMFNADLALAFDMANFTSNAVLGQVSCKLVVVNPGDVPCPTSSMLPHAQFYAANNARFVRDFRAVFLKMISSGCGNGVCTAI
jgi:hypothetical protein